VTLVGQPLITVAVQWNMPIIIDAVQMWTEIYLIHIPSHVILFVRFRGAYQQCF